MPNIGCTITSTARGIYGDFSITWDFGKNVGSWERLDRVTRTRRNYTKTLDFGERGDLFEAQDYWKGNYRHMLSLYPPGARQNFETKNSTGVPAFVHIFCGSAQHIFEKVTCGNFLSGEVLIWRLREKAEYEFWYGCV